MNLVFRMKHPFTIDIESDRVTFQEWVDCSRTAEGDKLLLDLVKTGRRVTIDLSKSKSVETSWVRLITMLSIQEGADVTVVGSNQETRDTAEYLGQLKHWKLKASTSGVYVDRGLFYLRRCLPNNTNFLLDPIVVVTPTLEAAEAAKRLLDG
jgi:hypothetical protein